MLSLLIMQKLDHITVRLQLHYQHSDLPSGLA